MFLRCIWCGVALIGALFLYKMVDILACAQEKQIFYVACFYLQELS
jgi:hypothetical protein